MPIFDYTCSGCGKSEEKIYLGSENIPKTVGCDCGDSAVRSDVNRFGIVGPIWSNLEDYSKAFYGSHGMRNGKEVRSYKDVKKFEEENSYVRLDTGSVKYRSAMDDMKQEALETDRVMASGGHEAVADYIYKQEMKDATGWSDSEYHNWKEISDGCKPTDADLSGGTVCGNAADPV